MTELLHDYNADEYQEENAEDSRDEPLPGTLLRQHLSQVAAPAERGHLDDLLYVASETSLLECEGISLGDALTVWRIVELARTLDSGIAKEIRM